MSDLTEVQKETYYIIKEFINQRKYAPSIRELCEIIGNNSTSTIYAKLKILKKKGYITYEPKKSRSIVILK